MGAEGGRADRPERAHVAGVTKKKPSPLKSFQYITDGIVTGECTSSMDKGTPRNKTFESEVRRQQLQLRIGAGLATIASLLLFIIFGGQFTRPAREILGLTTFMADGDGVYADCSLAENRYNKFCRQDYASTIRRDSSDTTSWRRPDSSPAFTLYDK